MSAARSRNSAWYYLPVVTGMTATSKRCPLYRAGPGILMTNIRVLIVNLVNGAASKTWTVTVAASAKFTRVSVRRMTMTMRDLTVVLYCNKPGCTDHKKLLLFPPSFGAWGPATAAAPAQTAGWTYVSSTVQYCPDHAPVDEPPNYSSCGACDHYPCVCLTAEFLTHE